MMTVVRYEVSDAIALITLDDPSRRNALSRAMRAGIRDALSCAESDADVRVILLTGTGDKAFCAGADLKEMADESVGVPGRDFMPIRGRNLDVRKPLIAAINGAALGGGFLLAQTADLVVAAEHAVFGMPEARVGRGAPWSVPLSRMVPQRIWTELCLLGDVISAQRAHEVGLVNRVVPTNELMPGARRMAEQIVANAPLTVKASLEMIQHASELGCSAAWDAADRAFEVVYNSVDAQEGPRAFVEGRKPTWTGA